jgi:hypothetical protein
MSATTTVRTIDDHSLLLHPHAMVAPVTRKKDPGVTSNSVHELINKADNLLFLFFRGRGLERCWGVLGGSGTVWC